MSMSDQQQVSQADLRQRVRLLEAENRRLMANQGQLVADTNRTVEMHVREIRLVKDENKRIKTENKELRDLCCFLDDDRQRTRRLSREWQRFGRYTSNVMKQEVAAYQEKLKDLERKQNELLGQNAELKQLCLYLDEQRGKNGHNKAVVLNSSESSCDGSGRSSDSETHKPEAEQQRRNVSNRCEQQRENKLRQLINEPQHDTSIDSHETQTTVDDSVASDELFGYIQRLENRVQHLEKSQEFLWRSESNLTSEIEETNQQRQSSTSDLLEQTATPEITLTDQQTIDHHALIDSQTSTGTASSGTTYASTNSDDSAVTAVYVLNDAETPLGTRSGTLTPIDEEDMENGDTESGGFMAGDYHSLNLDSLPSLRRFSFSEPSEIFNEKKKESLSRSHSLNLRRPVDVDIEPMSNSYSCRQQSTSSLAEAIKVLRVQEMAQRHRKRLMSTTETALVHQMCQVAWESLDRQSAQSFEENHNDSKSNLRISAV